MLRLDKLLKSKEGLGLDKIIQRAQNMDDLAARLRAELAPELGAEITAVNLREDGELVIVCRSSAWAARLRFEGDKLLAAARGEAVEATRLRVRVSS